MDNKSYKILEMTVAVGANQWRLKDTAALTDFNLKLIEWFLLEFLPPFLGLFIKFPI